MSTSNVDASWLTRKTNVGVFYTLNASFVLDGRERQVEIVIEPRPRYCDRGHWWARAFGGSLDIDGADCFPRYYMDVGRAQQEMREWLVWRISRLQTQESNRG